MKTETRVTRSPAETWEFARSLLVRLPERCVLALHGNLGSGKTCFVQGLARALGVERAVTSPTFTVVNEYRAAGRALVHVDLYRLQPGRDLEMLGLDEYFETPGIVAIEWAERATGILPADTIHITFDPMPDPDLRRITTVLPEGS
jgi:tRNA threonylcarbamoyladenosine biosynthesis protein TsaE